MSSSEIPRFSANIPSDVPASGPRLSRVRTERVTELFVDNLKMLRKLQID
jgi:hypothetical protein